MQIDVPYGITRTFSKLDLSAALERSTSALAIEGFGVLTEIVFDPPHAEIEGSPTEFPC